MTKDPTKNPTIQPSETTVERLPRHPASRPRAEADRELVPPDADFGEPADAAGGREAAAQG
ncbi:hypothetical protein Q0Z83_061910 [Actinoplanes sichuanensis]|uniref:Uncharacterized protein n=1 Tax=Actinoplanes sichuanensis TaxID=512349 RepID=A0ABW3ZZN4_9ACTN|nr:hypothetical protein [Actinoplanes sichuanensis]BEL08000.1 hypothetical protein Q0Z83_061910 [Actinoplanes sichuanensis]